MAEPVRNLPDPWHREPEKDDDLIVPLLHRWVPRPDGHFELLVRPATREDLLYPKLEDKISEGEPHSVARRQITDLLSRRFEPASLVLEDVCIRDLGPGLPEPSPDVTVVLEARPGERSSFSIAEEGVRPDLIIEIVSPSTAEIRKVDEEDKPGVYSAAGIPEYILLYLPRPRKGGWIWPLGYRLDSQGQYRRIEPDADGRIFSETTRLWFAPGRRIQVIDDRTGERLLYSDEEEAAKKAAQEKAAHEARARRAAQEKAAREARTRRLEEAGRIAAEEKAAREAEARRNAEAEAALLRGGTGAAEAQAPIVKGAPPTSSQRLQSRLPPALKSPRKSRPLLSRRPASPAQPPRSQTAYGGDRPPNRSGRLSEAS